MAIVKQAASWTATILMVAVLLAAAAFAALQVGGYKAEVIYSGSMRPMLDRGYLIFVKPTPSKLLNVGDVITFNDPREGKSKTDFVTHRIYEIKIVKGESVFITKGDANESVDPFQLQLKNEAGLYKYKVPYAGHMSFLVRSAFGYVLLIAIPFLLLMFTGLRKVWSSSSSDEPEAVDQRTPEILDFSSDGTWVSQAQTPAQTWKVPPATSRPAEPELDMRPAGPGETSETAKRTG